MALDFDTKLAGFLVDKELKFISKMLKEPEHPFIVIIGGSKIHDKMTALGNLLEIADKIIIASGAGYTFIKANGGKIGDSICENEMLEWAKKTYKNIRKRLFSPLIT